MFFSLFSGLLTLEVLWSSVVIWWIASYRTHCVTNTLEDILFGEMNADVMNDEQQG